MNKGFLFLFLLLLLVPGEGFAQLKKLPPKPEVMPSFPGGTQEMYKFIYSTIKYPVEARKKGVSGTVSVEFMVDEQGVLSEFLVVNSIGSGCDEEAIRVIKEMNASHRWTPAKTNGVPVKAMYTLSVKFMLQ